LTKSFDNAKVKIIAQKSGKKIVRKC